MGIWVYTYWSDMRMEEPLPLHSVNAPVCILYCLGNSVRESECILTVMYCTSNSVPDSECILTVVHCTSNSVQESECILTVMIWGWRRRRELSWAGDSIRARWRYNWPTRLWRSSGSVDSTWPDSRPHLSHRCNRNVVYQTEKKGIQSN